MKTEKFVLDSDDSNFLSDVDPEDYIKGRGIDAVAIFKSNSDLQFFEEMKIKTREMKEDLLNDFEVLKRFIILSLIVVFVELPNTSQADSFTKC